MVSFLAALVGVFSAISTGLSIWINREYEGIVISTPVDIDKYVGGTPGFLDRVQCVLVNRGTRATRTIHSKPFPIVAEEDEDFSGLLRTRNAKKNETATKSDKPKPPLVVGTIRKFLACYNMIHLLTHALTSSLCC